MSKLFDFIWSLTLLAAIVFSINVHSEEMIENGRQLFQTKCAMCHTNIQGTGHSTGPNLFGVVGRNVGSAKGYNYSEAMENNSSEIWDKDKLDKFVTNPQKFIPRTAMIFIGITDANQRRQLVEFLGTLKSVTK